MVSHRRKKQVRKVIKNFRKFVGWCKKAKKNTKARLHAFNVWGGNRGKTQCHACGKFIHQDWMTEHLHHHNEAAKKQAARAKKPGAKPVATPAAQTQWGPWSKVPNNQKTSVPTKQPQKQTPTANPQKKTTNGSQRPNLKVVKPPQTGGKKVAPTTGSDEGTDTPHAGHEAVIEFFNRWSQAYPSNFEVNHQDAEILGEMWHAVADAYNRKCAMLVEDNHFPPSIIEPYELCAKLAADMADHHKDMADRTQSTFATLIEAMQGPTPRDTNFAKPR